jgi:hypothetical protein
MVKLTKRQKEYDKFVEDTSKKEKFEELKVKYFWEQKSKELAKGFMLLILFFSIAGLWFNYVAYPEYLKAIKDGKITANVAYKNSAYFISGLMSILFMLVFYLFYSLAKIWIQDNWEKAADRARKELDIK